MLPFARPLALAGAAVSAAAAGVLLDRRRRQKVVRPVVVDFSQDDATIRAELRAAGVLGPRSLSPMFAVSNHGLEQLHDEVVRETRRQFALHEVG